MSRKVDNWIDGFMYFMQASETPNSFLRWIAISGISGAIQRRVKVKWLYQDIFPNVYVILVGPPGVTHKSTAIGQMRTMLQQIGVPTASESMTREGFIKQMTDSGDKNTSAIVALPDEFSDFIRPSGPNMVEFLTTIYGAQDQWQYTIRNRPTDTIKNAYLTMLAGTTPRWMANEFDMSFIDGGFAARTIFIHEQGPRFRKAFSRITDDMWRMYNDLIEDLYTISQNIEDFTWTDDGIRWFEHWYEETLPKQQMDYRLASYLGRKPTHVIKIAMVLAIADNAPFELNKKYLNLARKELEKIEPNMVRTFQSVGRNVYASDTERINDEIVQNGGLSEADIRRRNLHAMDKVKMDEILDSLVIMGYCQRVMKDKQWWLVPSGGD